MYKVRKNFSYKNLIILFCLVNINVTASENELTDKTNLNFEKNLSSKNKMPSKYTIEWQKNICKNLPFTDKRDLKESKKGFIAGPTFKKIMSEDG